LSELSVLRFGPFGITFLHKGGGATDDNCKREQYNMSFVMEKKN